MEIGSSFSICAQNDSAVKYLEETVHYFESHPEFLLKLLECYNTLGISYKNTSLNILKANYYSTKAASLCLLHERDTIIPLNFKLQILYVAAETNLACNLLEQAKHLGVASYYLADQNKDLYPLRYLRAANIMGSIYLALRKPDSAKTFIDIATKYDRLISGKTVSQYTIDIEYAKYYYYSAIQQDDSSLLTALKIYNYDPSFTSALLVVVPYIQLHQPRKAAAYLQLAENKFSPITDEFRMMDFYHFKCYYLIQYGNRDSAIQFFNKYDSTREEIYGSDRLKMLASIESEYNLEEKQKNIFKLDQANRAAKENIRYKNNLIIIFALAILLFAVGMAIFFLLARQQKIIAKNQSIEAQRNKILLEQKLLRTQMEPHFIFNTLNVVKGMVRLDERDKAILYLDMFARLLRTSLENSRENYVQVSEEIDALHDYVSLQAIRFENKFDYSFDIYEGYEEDVIKIPPMLLQPFVENAIHHGLSSMKVKGAISIQIKKTAGRLHCLIRDNGIGLIREKTGSHKSLAIQIARERIAIISKETGQSGSVDIVSNDANESGTTVELYIPFI